MPSKPKQPRTKDVVHVCMGPVPLLPCSTACGLPIGAGGVLRVMSEWLHGKEGLLKAWRALNEDERCRKCHYDIEGSALIEYGRSLLRDAGAAPATERAETKAERDARLIGYRVRDNDSLYWFRGATKLDHSSGHASEPLPRPVSRAKAENIVSMMEQAGLAGVEPKIVPVRWPCSDMTRLRVKLSRLRTRALMLQWERDDARAEIAVLKTEVTATRRELVDAMTTIERLKGLRHRAPAPTSMSLAEACGIPEPAVGATRPSPSPTRTRRIG
ncbi:MAG: hypothetical protein ACHREM_04215 [Polyangiales bacterium]